MVTAISITFSKSSSHFPYNFHLISCLFFFHNLNHDTRGRHWGCCISLSRLVLLSLQHTTYCKFHSSKCTIQKLEWHQILTCSELITSWIQWERWTRTFLDVMQTLNFIPALQLQRLADCITTGSRRKQPAWLHLKVRKIYRQASLKLMNK